jgi:hypothetical protein
MPYSAFDKNISTTTWRSTDSSYVASKGGLPNFATTTLNSSTGLQVDGEWVQIQMPSAITVSSYTLRDANQALTQWALLGSNNGTTWWTVDASSKVVSVTSVTRAPAAPTAYLYHRLVVTNANSTVRYTEVTELELIGW